MGKPVSHTAGPWFATPDRTSEHEDTLILSFSIVPDGEYRGGICDLQSCGHIQGISRAETRANGRLIAAAPDLLAALIAIDSLGSDSSLTEAEADAIHAQVKAAIAAATGAK